MLKRSVFVFLRWGLGGSQETTLVRELDLRVRQMKVGGNR